MNRIERLAHTIAANPWINYLVIVFDLNQNNNKLAR